MTRLVNVRCLGCNELNPWLNHRLLDIYESISRSLYELNESYISNRCCRYLGVHKRGKATYNRYLLHLRVRSSRTAMLNFDAAHETIKNALLAAAKR